jgi:hypothetical protein
MIPDTSNRYARTAPRRPVPCEVLVDVVLCGEDACIAQVVDEQGGSLGLILEGPHAERALAHRPCCTRRTVRMRIPGLNVGDEVPPTPREVAAELIHVTALGDGVKAGVGFLVSCLDTKDVQHLLALWARFRQPAG